MAHIPGLYLKPESFSPSYGRKKMTDTQRLTHFHSRSLAYDYCGLGALANGKH
jgi:hypothetical protein